MNINETEVVKLYSKDSWSTYDIADKYETYPNKIRRILKKHDVKLRGKSEAQKDALAKGKSKHPTAGRQRTDEEKMAISSSAVKFWDDMNDEEKEKRRQQSKENWDKLSPAKRADMRKKASESIRQAAREGSKLEKEVQGFLARAGYRYEAHKKDLVPTKKYEIDLYVPALRTIIEVDGLSHFEPIWGEKQLAHQRKADAEKDGVVLGKGFKIIRIENRSGSMAISKLKELETALVATLKEIENKTIDTNLKVITYE